MHDDTLDQWQHTARPGWGWVWPIAIALGILWMVAPRAEAWLWPVFGKEEIVDIARQDGRLCWTRISQKYRVPEVQNYDAILDRVSPVTGQIVHTFPEIFNEAPPNDPVSTERAPPVGWSRRRLCILLPPRLAADQPVRLRQTIHFRGALGLWDLPIILPTILSPPGAALPM